QQEQCVDGRRDAVGMARHRTAGPQREGVAVRGSARGYRPLQMRAVADRRFAAHVCGSLDIQPGYCDPRRRLSGGTGAARMTRTRSEGWCRVVAVLLVGTLDTK